MANERKEKQVGVSLITYTPHLNSGRTDISTLSSEHREMKIDFSVTEVVTVMFNVYKCVFQRERRKREETTKLSVKSTEKMHRYILWFVDE